MLQVNGMYEKGCVTLDHTINVDKAMPVVVSFLDEENTKPKKRLSLEDFSFLKARELSKGYQGNLSDAVLEERKLEE